MSVDDIQAEVFKNLINAVLTPAEVQIESLEDLKQGTAFPKFVQNLLGETIEGWKEIPESWRQKSMFKTRITSQVSTNFTIIHKYLSQKENVFKNVRAPEQNRDWLSILWLLISKYYIVQPKKSLITLIAQKLVDFEPSLQIKNMGASWSDCLPFIALLSKVSNGQIEYNDKGDFTSNFNYIKDSCQTLNIPFVLTEKSISPKPDENCICIQAVAILKSTGELETQNDQSQDKEEAEKKKFNEKIDEYKKYAHDTLELIDKEQNQIDKISNCLSIDDVQNKRKYIHDFIASTKNTCQTNFYKVSDMWKIIEKNSNRTKLPIPEDVINIDDVKQKFDHLIETIDLQNQNLKTDESKVKHLETEIKQISTLQSARDKFNEMKGQFDMDNWQQFNKSTCVYILGDKLFKYEKELKVKIDQYEEKVKKFDKINDKIVNEIENNSKDLIGLDNSLSSLNANLNSLSTIYQNIHEIDPSVNITFSYDDYQSRINDLENKVKEYKVSVSKNEFIRESALIVEKIQAFSSEIQKLDNYKNDYDSLLCTKVRNEHSIEEPSISNLEYLFIQMEKDPENEKQFEEIKEMFDKVKKEYDDKWTFLEEREAESRKIEHSCFNAKTKSNNWKTLDLVKSVQVLNETQKLVSEADQIKKWEDDAKGSSIDMYNEYMKEAHDVIDNANQIIEDKFISYLKEIKDSIDTVKNEKMCRNPDLDVEKSNYKKGLEIIEDNLNKMSVLDITNSIMAFYKYDDEIDEIQKELEQLDEEITNHINNFFERYLECANEEKAKIQNIIDEQAQLSDELQSDTSNLNDLSIEDIDQKGSKMISKYIEIHSILKSFNEYNKELTEKVETPDIAEIQSFLLDLVIIYKSTLLLDPKSCSENIKERIEKCSDSDFSSSMVVLYLHKFSKEPESSRFKIENINEAKEEIESKINPDKAFLIDVSKQICNLIQEMSIESQLKVNILSEYLEFLPDFEETFLDYLVTSIGNSPDIRSMQSKLEFSEISSEKINDLFNKSLDKIDAITRGKRIEIKNSDPEAQRTAVIDMGSFETRIGFNDAEQPKVFPTLIGFPRYQQTSMITKDAYIGYETIAPSHTFTVQRPIVEGIPDNFDHFKKMVKYSLNLLGHENYPPILFSEPPNIDRYKREYIIQILFEKFRVPSYFSICSSVLDILSTGRDTGFVVDVGQDITRFTAVNEGFSLPFFSTYQKYGGKDISDLLYQELVERSEYLTTQVGPGIIAEIKANNCYVSLDCEIEDQTDFREDPKNFYKLPEQGFLAINRSRYQTSEYLFNPNKFPGHYNVSNGLSKNLYDTIEKTGNDFHKMFYSNIILSGGTSRMEGFKERVEKDLGELAPASKINVKKTHEYSTWEGGCIFASLDSFPLLTITNDEYIENGGGFVHRKCIY